LIPTAGGDARRQAALPRFAKLVRHGYLTRRMSA
jgi:hypothetical protein